MSTTVTQLSISIEAAREVLDACVAKANAIGASVCISVSDTAGNLMALYKMDGTPILSIQMAQDKAYTVAAFGIATHEWWEIVRADPSLLHGFVKTDRVIIFGGGIPLIHKGIAIGAVGVSGATADEDQAIAEAGADALVGMDTKVSKTNGSSSSSRGRAPQAASNGSAPHLGTRALGCSGLVVSEVGLGCMSMSAFYNDPGTERESIAVIQRALDLGCNFLNTSDLYGPYTNEELLGRALKGRRQEAVVASMFGLILGSDGVSFDSSPKYIRKACDASLKRLGTDYLDVYTQHRVDPKVPIEETVGAMADLVSAGKVRYIGLSEAAPATVRRAHAVHPISVVQTELSLYAQSALFDILPTLRDLGIGLVAYSPLGRGLATGRWAKSGDVDSNDYRANDPRFAGDNLRRNAELTTCVSGMANSLGVSSSQLALAWVLAQGPDVVPIPGTRRTAYLEDNLAAARLRLTGQQVADLNAIIGPGSAAGDRYADMSFVAG